MPLAVPEVLPVAAREITDNAAWYDERRAGYGDRFLDETLEVFDLIDEAPLVGAPWVLPGVPEGVRHIVLKTFPVSVVYVTEPRVVVVALVGAQEPTAWIDRLDEL